MMPNDFYRTTSSYIYTSENINLTICYLHGQLLPILSFRDDSVYLLTQKVLHLMLNIHRRMILPKETISVFTE